MLKSAKGEDMWTNPESERKRFKLKTMEVGLRTMEGGPGRGKYAELVAWGFRKATRPPLPTHVQTIRLSFPLL